MNSPDAALNHLSDQIRPETQVCITMIDDRSSGVSRADDDRVRQMNSIKREGLIIILMVCVVVSDLFLQLTQRSCTSPSASGRKEEQRTHWA